MRSSPHSRQPLRLVSTESLLQPAMSLVEIHRGLLNKSDAAGAEAWRTFAPGVFRLLRSALGDHVEIDDLVQEVFLRLVQSAQRVEDPQALHGFVLGITTRIIRKHLSFRWARRWLQFLPWNDLDNASDTRSTTDAQVEARVALRRFYALLDQFDVSSRLAFVLRRIHGMELTEVAAALEISLATVKRRLTHVEDRVKRRAAQDPLLATYIRSTVEHAARDEADHV